MSAPSSPTFSTHRRSSSPLLFGRRAVGLLVAAGAAVTVVALAPDAHAAGVEIEFTAVAGATAYRLYYDTDGPSPPFDGYQANEGSSPVEVLVSALPDPNAPAISLTGLPSCTRYYFAVTAMTGASESPYSDPGDAMIAYIPTPVDTAPLPPGGLLLSWPGLPADDDGYVPTYRIEFDTDSGEPYEGSGSPVDVVAANLSDPFNPSYPLLGLTPGTTYYLVVESVCAGADPIPSDEVSAVAPGAGGGGVGGAGPGGTGGTGGTGTGGTNPGTGGSGLGVGGGGVGAADPSNEDGSIDSEGECGCRTPGGGTTPAPWFALPALLGLLCGRRRSSC